MSPRAQQNRLNSTIVIVHSPFIMDVPLASSPLTDFLTALFLVRLALLINLLGALCPRHIDAIQPLYLDSLRRDPRFLNTLHHVDRSGYLWAHGITSS